MLFCAAVNSDELFFDDGLVAVEQS